MAEEGGVEGAYGPPPFLERKVHLSLCKRGEKLV